MGTESGSSAELLRLRHAGRCRACGVELAAGTTAMYDRDAKTASCVNCPDPEVLLGAGDVGGGTAGASALREYERRKNAREVRIREAHPRAGGLILALTEVPQSTTAWATGAKGEERLGRQLDNLAGLELRVLHDRRIPGTKANIDHLVVCASGVYVIDAKKYKGSPSKRVDGGLLRPRVERLMVGSRDCTKLVAGVRKQVDVVRSALEANGLGGIAVSGMLCFVDAEWPMFGGDFTIDGVDVLWPKRAARQLLQAGELDAAGVERVWRPLASAFPQA